MKLPNASGVLPKIEDEIKKFGDQEINLSLSQATTEKNYSIQKWSDRWNCYLSVDNESLSELQDGDRITIVKKGASKGLSQVEVSQLTSYIFQLTKWHIHHNFI